MDFYSSELKKKKTFTMNNNDVTDNADCNNNNCSGKKRRRVKRVDRDEGGCRNDEEEEEELRILYEDALQCCLLKEEEWREWKMTKKRTSKAAKKRKRSVMIEKKRLEMKKKKLMMKKRPSLAVEEKLMTLRRIVISRGLPFTEFYCLNIDDFLNEEEEKEGHENGEQEDEGSVRVWLPSLRSCVWKVLLGALSLDTKEYLDVLKLGPSGVDEKIRDDTFRTYKNNNQFWSKITESQLARVLNAAARALVTKDSKGVEGVYVQGMNVLLAPLLYIMPTEVDAFASFTALVAKHCPRYILSNLEGVHSGCALVETCLRILDPSLHTYLTQTLQLQMEIFTFQFVLTLFANVSQLDEILIVWDAVFAFGVHFNCLLIATHIILMRNEIMEESSAFRVQQLILKSPLHAEELVACAMKLLRYIPDGVMQDLLLHPVETVQVTTASASMSQLRSTDPFALRRRSNSASRLRTVADTPDSRPACNASRISYLSTSTVGSVVKDQKKPPRRPVSAGRAASRTILPPRAGSSISHSRLLNPSMRASGARDKPVEPVVRPVRRESPRTGDRAGGTSRERPGNWVRSLRAKNTSSSSSAPRRQPSPSGKTRRHSSPSPSSYLSRAGGSRESSRGDLKLSKRSVRSTRHPPVNKNTVEEECH